MSLLDEIQAETRGTGSPCAIQTVFSRLDKRDAADLRAALENPNVTSASIGRALAKRGLLTCKNVPDVVSRHRRRDCRCEAN